MLIINYEFRKGILFIRLNGHLTINTSNKVKEEITDMIIDNGIKNVVFNISQISLVDEIGLHDLYKNFELCRKNCGNALLCGLNKKNEFLVMNCDYFNKEYLVDDELSAFKKIII